MSNPPLCVAVCAIPGRHASDCDDETCGGCLVALAADGVRLCAFHLRAIPTDAAKLADLHDEMGLRLANSGQAGEKTSGTRNPGLALNLHAVEMRDHVCGVLMSWSKMIYEEKGVTPPADNIHAMAAFIGLHSYWLAAHPAADDASNELRELVRRAWSVAYPSGTRRFQVKHDGKPVPCPIPLDNQPCPGTLWTILRRTDSLLPSALACDVHAEHEIPADQWMTLGRKLRKAA